MGKITNRELAMLCQLSYRINEDSTLQIHSTIIDMGFTNVHFMSNFLICDKGETRVFVFRGSKTIEDWMTNITASMSSTKFGMIHDGFRSRMARIDAKIQTNHPSSLNAKHIIATGHSLGGAMAVLFGIQHHCDVVTFGQPMVGNSKMSRPRSLVRYVNNMDIVPRLPLKIAGYAHIGTERYLDYNGNIISHPSWFDKFKDRVKSRFKAISKWQKFDDFYDHDIQLYINKL